jgi:hypothetical protein
MDGSKMISTVSLDEYMLKRRNCKINNIKQKRNINEHYLAPEAITALCTFWP